MPENQCKGQEFVDTNELKSSRINIRLCSKMYKKVTSKYVVMGKKYQQIRGKNLTFLWKKPCNYQ